MSDKKSKQAVITIPTTWLVAGALVIAAAVGVKAYYSNVAQKASVDEVKSTQKIDGTFTGVVNREPANSKDKERYVLTTDGGTKYILIGLKKSYVDKNNSDDTNKNTNDDKQNNGQRGKPTTKPTPRPTSTTKPKADSDDVNSFEQYVGKKVTITGMVVPVQNDNISPKPVETAKKDKTPDLAKGKAVVSPKPSASDNGVRGWDYDRLVVKSIAVMQ